MKTIMRVCTLALCTLLATGCQKKSGNIWDDNQTGAKYKNNNNNTSNLWDKSKDGLAGPADEDFIPLNDEDLKNQFADIAAQSTRELGEKGMPSADQFETPKGSLASIFAPIFFETDQHVVTKKDHLEAIHRAAAYLNNCSPSATRRPRD